MKTLRNILIGLSALALWSCNKDTVELPPFDITPEISISSDSDMFRMTDEKTADLVFLSTGGEAGISVTASNRNWSVAGISEGDWVSMEKFPESFVIKTQPNDTQEPRTKVLTLTIVAAVDAEGNPLAGAAKEEITINVRQGIPGSEIAPGADAITIPARSTEAVFHPIGANGDQWTFDASSQWLAVDKVDETQISFRPISINETTEPRTTLVDIYYESDPDNKYTITVTQTGLVSLSLNAGTVVADENGNGFNIAVTTNATDGWILEDYDASWISIDSQTETVLQVVAMPYADGEEKVRREAVLTVRAGDDTNYSTATLNVVQMAVNTENLVFRVNTAMSEGDDWTNPLVIGGAVIPLAGDVNCTVDWGDGIIENITHAAPNHIYKEKGTYVVQVYGTVTALDMRSIKAGYRGCVDAVMSWGHTGLKSLSHAFDGARLAGGIPAVTGDALAEVEDFSYAFNASGIASIPADLFKASTGATTFSHIFENSTLRSIPAGLFSGNTLATDFSSAFAYTAVRSIPADLFATNTKANNFSGIFTNCASIRTIPVALFANCPEVGSFHNAFAYTGLTEIPVGLFDANVNVTSFGSTFESTSVKTIPETLFQNCPKVTTFANTFAYCPLTGIPAGLFAGNSEVTSFDGTFFRCGGVTEIPETLFANCPKATNFRSTFTQVQVTSLPENLFAAQADVTTFDGTFSNCTALKTLPAGLFANNTKLNNLTMTFMVCGIESIPATLFVNNPDIVTFENVFSSCQSLAALPEDLFVNNAKIKSFKNTFSSCHGLYELPEGLFRNCAAASDMSGTFASCMGLTIIPEGLFAGCPNLGTLYGCFSGNTSIASLPAGLFDNNRKVYDFSYCFNECGAGITGESPYTMIGDVKVHLYERHNYSAEFTDAGGKKCYHSCTGLSDYASIPALWKED